MNDPPTVVASVPGSASVGVAGTVSALASDPDEGDAVSLLWSVTAGSPCTIADPQAAATTVTCTAAGTFALTVTATDQAGATAIATKTLTASASLIAWHVRDATVVMTRRGGVATLDGVVPGAPGRCPSTLAFSIDGQAVFAGIPVRLGRTCFAVSSKGFAVLHLGTGRIYALLHLPPAFALPADVARFGIAFGDQRYVDDVPGRRVGSTWSSRVRRACPEHERGCEAGHADPRRVREPRA